MNMNYSSYRCPHGYGWCIAPAGNCPHWQGIFCELDLQTEKLEVEERNNESESEINNDCN